MPRVSRKVVESLSADQLRVLVDARAKLDGLEKKKAELEKQLAAIEKEIAKIYRSVEGKPAGRIARKVRRKKTAKRPVRKVTKKATAKKATRTTAVRKTATKKSAGKPTLEDVVVELLKGKKDGLPFQEILVAIQTGKLYRSKSKSFDNVLRRTISTSKKVKRVKRGVYAAV